jgi:hypothetical protein
VRITQRVFECLLPALYRKGQLSWNPTVNNMTATVLRKFQVTVYCTVEIYVGNMFVLRTWRISRTSVKSDLREIFGLVRSSVMYVGSNSAETECVENILCTIGFGWYHAYDRYIICVL